MTAPGAAAMSALAARWMARPASRIMALIGNGAQSEFQTIAFHHMLGIQELRLFDMDLFVTQRLERNLAARGLEGLRVVRCASTAAPPRVAAIVTTAAAHKRKGAPAFRLRHASIQAVREGLQV